MQFNPGLAAVALSPTCIQFGTGTDAVVVEGLSDPDRGFVTGLIRGLPDGTETAAAAALGVPAGRAAALLEALSPLLVACSTADVPPRGFRTDRLRADVRAWSAAYRQNAGPVLDRRAACVVVVSGLGRTGSLIAQALATAGVGTLVLSDACSVAASDVGSGAYRLTDIGMRRTDALRRQLRAAEPGLLVLQYAAGTALPVPADLVVCVDSYAIHPATAGVLAGSGYPHLPVLAQEETHMVGPLVQPGDTACLECLERLRADADPASPGFAQAWHSGRAAASGEGLAGEAAGSQAAAGLAALQTLLYLDGIIRPAAWSQILHLRADGSVVAEHVPRHQGCGCTLQHAREPEVA